MNSTSLRLPMLPGQTGRRGFSVAARLTCGVQQRASLPVVSNRAFIRAWAAGRTKIGAAALAAHRLTK